MEEELWLAGMSKVHAKIWADKYDELGRIADSRKVLVEGLERENRQLKKLQTVASDFLEACEPYLSDSTFDGDYSLSNSHAELSVLLWKLSHPA